MRCWPILVALLVLGSPAARAADPATSLAAETPEHSETEKRFDPAILFGDLSRRVVIFLQTAPWMVRESDIDRIVGDPWKLYPGTAAKVRALPQRLRLEVYSMMVDNLPRMKLEPVSQARATPPNAHDDVVAFGLDGAAAQQLFSNVASAFTSFFSPEELIDFGVYLLSRTPAFPMEGDTDRWHRWKNVIVNGEIWLGLAFVLAEARANNGALGLSGWLFSLDDERGRLGWYTNISNLGFALNPQLSGGARLTTFDFDAWLGYLRRVNANGTEDREGIETVVRPNWFARILKDPEGWQVGGQLSSRYVFTNASPRYGHSVEGGLQVYVRKTELAGNPDLNLMLRNDVMAATDGRAAANASISLENALYQMSGLLHASVTQPDPTSSPVTTGGLAFNTAFGGSPHFPEEDLGLLRSRIAEQERYLARLNAELREFEPRLDSIGTGSLKPHAERELVRKLRMQQGWIISAEAELGRQQEEYADLLRHKYRYGDDTLKP